MKSLFDKISNESATIITRSYSTSFSIAVRLLDESIRQDVYNIYGFVRVADEIVDSFNDYPQKELFDKFEEDYFFSLEHGISTNPVINAFQNTLKKYNIDLALVDAFLKSMRADLEKTNYNSKEEIDEYIYGSADVVGLMCLKIFVKGDENEYERLKESAIKLGSAFQKVNFLRDLKQDYEDLNRVYFPEYNPNNFSDIEKKRIVEEIEQDFALAFQGLKQLPKEARLGVFVAYKYYSQLLKKIVKTPAKKLISKRIRVSNSSKAYLLFETYMLDKLSVAS